MGERERACGREGVREKERVWERECGEGEREWGRESWGGESMGECGGEGESVGERGCVGKCGGERVWERERGCDREGVGEGERVD